MVTDDILLVCGLESQIVTSPKVLPSGLSSNQQLNIQLCDLIENFPGTLVVVRSVMERDNVLFSKASSTKTRNVEKLFPQSLKDVGVCDTDAVAEHCRSFDPLRVLLGQKSQNGDYNPTQFKGGRPTPYFEIATGIKDLELNHTTDKDFLKELFPTEYWKGINQLSNEEAFYTRKFLIILLHMRFTKTPMYETPQADKNHLYLSAYSSNIKDSKLEGSELVQLLVQSFDDDWFHQEGINNFVKNLNLPKEKWKDMRNPNLGDETEIDKYVFAAINHKAVNKGLHVHAYCTEQHQHEVDMAFVAALAKRRHATVVAFRENITAPCSPNQGFGYNLYTRAHDFMNASLDARYSVILPSELQEISDVQRLVRVREMLTPPLPSTKPRISLFEYLACAGARLACTRNRGQWRGQGNLNDKHRNYRDTVFPKGINAAVAECQEAPPYELHGTFRQNVIFAGNSPSPHCLKVSMNSLVPLTVETRDENGFSYRVRVDLRPVLQTQLMSLSRTGGQRNSYAEALALHDTPIFRRILLTHNDKSQRIPFQVMGPLSEEYDQSDLHGEYKHLNTDQSQHRKIVDIGCKVDLDRHSGKDFEWPVDIVPDNFFQDEYGSHWTNPLPIETSLRDLDSYRVFAPEFIDFAHMGSAEVHMRLPGLEKLVNTPIGHVHGNLIDDHSTLITPLLQDRLDDRQPLRAHFVDFNLEGRHESWKLYFLTKYMPKEHHIDYSREKFLTRIPFDDQHPDNINYMLNKKGQPTQPLFTKVEDLVPFDPLDDLLILMVDIGETFKWTDCSLACAIQARHLVVIALGTFPIDSSPTTEQLFLAFPRANYICNLTQLSHNFTGKENMVRKANRINTEIQALNNHMMRLIETYDSDDTETDDSDLDDLDALM